jgi:gas vesicle protein
MPTNPPPMRTQCDARGVLSRPARAGRQFKRQKEFIMKRDSSGRFRGRGESSYEQAEGECRTSAIGASIGALIGGAALGAIATYLLDSEQGADRRASLGKTAHRAFDSTADALRTAYEKTAHGVGHALASAGEKASAVGAAAYESLPDSQDIRRAGRRFFDSAGDAADNASDTARSWLGSARSMLPSYRSMKREQHSDYAMNPGAVGVTAAGTLVLGAASMWLFDPSKGRARRAWIGQKATRFLNEIGGFARATGRHIRNKSRGYYHQASSAVSNAAEHVTPTKFREPQSPPAPATDAGPRPQTQQSPPMM